MSHHHSPKLFCRIERVSSGFCMYECIARMYVYLRIYVCLIKTTVELNKKSKISLDKYNIFSTIFYGCTIVNKNTTKYLLI